MAQHGTKPMYAIGIDMGGTKTLAVACDLSGQILLERRIATPRSNRDAAISVILALIDEIRSSTVLAGNHPIGIGAGFAGLVNYHTGHVHSSIMLPDWIDVPLQSILEDSTQLPSRVDNDANAAAFAEAWIGSERGASTLVGLTIGTGIGGGLIIDGKLFRGADGTAAEFGNMTIDYQGPLCDCGSHGCLNPLASATALSRRSRERIRLGDSPRMLQLASGDIERVTAEIVAQAAREGDIVANGLIRETAFFLGVGIANLVNALNPEAVVLGGGLADVADLMIEEIQIEVARRAFPLPATRAKIVASVLRNRAGALGAAGILIEGLEGKQSRGLT